MKQNKNRYPKQLDVWQGASEYMTDVEQACNTTKHSSARGIILAVMNATLLLTAASTSLISTSVLAADQEKCYGIVKAGMNDCATATSSCASSATKDAQPDAFLFVPQGLCDKIVGASKNPLASVTKNSK
jgi:uncharacterized membrane protein